MMLYNDNVAHTIADKCNMSNTYICSVTDLDDSDRKLPSFDTRTDTILDNIEITDSEIVNVINIQIRIMDPIF